MTYLIFSYWMTKQKMAIYLLFIVVIFVLSLSFMQLDENVFNQIAYHKDFQSYYEHMTVEYLSIVFPLMVVMISMHHETRPLEMLYAYFSREKVTIYKMLSYIIFIIWISLIAVIFIYCMPSFLTHYYHPNLRFFLMLLMLSTQNLIVLGFVFLLIHKRHQSFAILIAIACIIYHMQLQDNFNTFRYYLLPIFDQHMLSYKYNFSYQILYLALCLCVSYIKMIKTEIV